MDIIKALDELIAALPEPNGVADGSQAHRDWMASGQRRALIKGKDYLIRAKTQLLLVGE